MDKLTQLFTEISALDNPRKIQFYERIAFNLTIGVRSIWSTPTTTDKEKLEAIKILNELSHDIFNWIWSLRRDAIFDDMSCCEQIKGDLTQNRNAGGEIAEAVKDSHRLVFKN